MYTVCISEELVPPFCQLLLSHVSSCKRNAVVRVRSKEGSANDGCCKFSAVETGALELVHGQQRVSC